MSYEELGLYIETKVEQEKDKYKYDVTLQFYNAVFNNAKKPYEEYSKIIKNIDGNKPMSDTEMENMARKLNAMFGGKVKKSS